MRKYEYTGGAIVSCATCGKLPAYGEEYLLVTREEFEDVKDTPCPPHKLVLASDKDAREMAYA